MSHEGKSLIFGWSSKIAKPAKTDKNISREDAKTQNKVGKSRAVRLFLIRYLILKLKIQ
jgi:hypothetical protein